jgi:predicted transcriptional regulator
MKIELVKETKVNGEVIYFTNVDSKYVNDSLTLNEEKAKVIYDNIVKNKGEYTSVEILESTEK